MKSKVFILTDEGEGYFYPSQEVINARAREFWGSVRDGTEGGLMGPRNEWDKKAAAWTLLENGGMGVPRRKTMK